MKMLPRAIIVFFSVLSITYSIFPVFATSAFASFPGNDTPAGFPQEHVSSTFNILFTDSGMAATQHYLQHIETDPVEFCTVPETAGFKRRQVEILDIGFAEICSFEAIAVPEGKSPGMCKFNHSDIFDFDLAEPLLGSPRYASINSSFHKLNPFVAREVKRNINVFRNRIHDRFTQWLGRSRRYLPMMKNILKEEGLPEDLAFLPLIESGFNPRAYSRSKAAGPWQFIAGTAKRYGLKINWWVDERRDPVKSTRAAARYLKDLYKMFDSWSLALAAYNAGENRIKRGLMKTGSSDFWKLANTRYIRRETKNYVPKFLAARLIATAPEKYGFRNVEYQEHLVFDEITINTPLTIDEIARCAETTKPVIKDLNPELRRWITPPNVGGYAIRIPRGMKNGFEKNLSKIPVRKRIALNTYRVRAGDTVSGISEKTGVPSREIISINNLNRKAFIRKGQTLMLPMPADYGTGFIPSNLPTIVLKNGYKARKYRVRWGDTVSGIAINANISEKEIAKLNRLNNNFLIREGQTILIPVRKN
jgi:membrane-bound lytic murein transglycosylase D